MRTLFFYVTKHSHSWFSLFMFNLSCGKIFTFIRFLDSVFEAVWPEQTLEKVRFKVNSKKYFCLQMLFAHQIKSDFLTKNTYEREEDSSG